VTALGINNRNTQSTNRDSNGAVNELRSANLKLILKLVEKLGALHRTVKRTWG
jgi:hypothetical protein